MSNKKNHKLPFTVKLAITFAALAVIFLALSIVSAIWSVNRTVDAINAIGEVDYSEASKVKIDLALSYYEALDANIDLPEKVTNAEKLTDAKKEYVRLGIKKAYLADKNGEAEEAVKQYVVDARETFDEYFSEGDISGISNYEDLIALEKKYTSDAQTPDSTAPADKSQEENIELC